MLRVAFRPHLPALRWRLLALAAALPLLLLLALAAFPWGYFAPRAANALTGALGLQVTVASAHRLDHVSLEPTVVLRGVRIGQPAWAGPRPLAEIAEVRLRFAAVPLLFGRFRPHALDIVGARIALRRDADGRANWEVGAGGPVRRPLRIEHVTIRDSTISLVQRSGQFAVSGPLMADAKHGLLIEARGAHRGLPFVVTVRGGALDAPDPDRPWPVIAHARSPLVTVDAEARMDHPLDLAHYSARASASGRDILFLSDLIDAGLPPTRPFSLTATVRHDRPDWRIKDVNGTIGRSRLKATLAITRRGGRVRLDGTVAAATLDFDDFASDEQRARGAAKRAAEGKRLIPATRIRLDHLGRLDGRVRLDAAQLLGSAPFRDLHTIVTLDRRRLTLAPLAADMRVGRVAGQASVDHRGATPVLELDVRARSTIDALIVPNRDLTGPLDLHFVLRGAGSTVREAASHASGAVGLVVPSGSMRRDYATYLGGNVLAGVGALLGGGGRDERTPLRCVVARFEARNGVLTPAPLVLDTPISRGDGRGRLTLGDERVDFVFIGRAKHPGPLLSTTPTRLFGSFVAPQIDIRPPRAKELRHAGLFGRIGALVGGLRPAGVARTRPAPNADCAALERAALR